MKSNQPYYDDGVKPHYTSGNVMQEPPKQLIGAVVGQPVTAGPPLGVGGLPMARPRFGLTAEDGIRHEQSCCGYGPGPNIPLHWYDGGAGWVTRYFYDEVSYNAELREAGKFRCQVVLPNGQLCNHEVPEADCCKGNCCWTTLGVAHQLMRDHVVSMHGAQQPPRRQWTSELCDTEGCLDSYCCAPCMGSRQMMALAGWEDKHHWGWCLFFTFMGFRTAGSGRNQIVYWIPPHVYVAILTRHRMVTLNNIDEGFCTTLCTSLCCSLCSVAQTYRELSASGVWPGGVCNSTKPVKYGCIGVSTPPVNTATMV